MYYAGMFFRMGSPASEVPLRGVGRRRYSMRTLWEFVSLSVIVCAVLGCYKSQKPLEPASQVPVVSVPLEPPESPPLISPPKTELEERMEIAKNIFKRNTQQQITEAADYLVIESKKYERNMDVLEAIACLIDEAMSRPKAIGAQVTSVVAAQKGDASIAVGESANVVRVNQEDISVRDAAETVVWRIYEQYMAPIWAQQEAAELEQMRDQQRLQYYREQGKATSEQLRQQREDRAERLRKQNQAITEKVQTKGEEDQRRREAGWRYGR